MSLVEPLQMAHARPALDLGTLDVFLRITKDMILYAVQKHVSFDTFIYLYLVILTYNTLTPDGTRELPGKLSKRLMPRLKDDIHVLFLANVSSLEDDSNCKGTTARGKSTVPIKFHVQNLRRIN